MSCTYDAIAAQIPDMNKCDRETLDELRSKYSFLPDEYAQYLAEVGWGEVAGFMFYSGPVELQDIFDEETAEASARVILIGDDMAGGHLGYIEVGNKWMLTDFDHLELPGRPSPIDVSLCEFVLSRLKKAG